MELIIKEIKLPIKIKLLQAILTRLRKDHPNRQEIQEELAKRLAGFKGEQSLDYYFNFLPPQEFYILHNLRLANPNNAHFFQIDILVVTPSLLIIIEVKNISGTITFDPIFDQVIWKNPITGVEKVIQDPVRQVNHQTYQLLEWAKSKKIAQLPAESFVVFTNQNTVLKMKSNRKDYFQKITRSTKLLEKLDHLKRKHSTAVLSVKEMKKISNQFIKHHTPERPNLLKQYNIKDTDILSGVLCENCLSLTMRYKRKKWHCQKCSHISKDAHRKALEDYSLIFEESITNHQCKSYLQLPTNAITYHLLQSMKLKNVGSNKGRTYHLPPIKAD